MRSDTPGLSARRSSIPVNIVDTLLTLLPSLDQAGILREAGVERGQYVLVSLHRATSTDSATQGRICDVLERIAERETGLFPAQPRLPALLKGLADGRTLSRVRIVDPLPYRTVLGLMARVDVTDSGGIQEETTALGVPGLTLRRNVERPITVEEGTKEWSRRNRRLSIARCILQTGGSMVF